MQRTQPAEAAAAQRCKSADPAPTALLPGLVCTVIDLSQRRPGSRQIVLMIMGMHSADMHSLKSLRAH